MSTQKKTPGRPKISPGKIAPKNGPRPRLYSIVIHDAIDTAKDILAAKIDGFKPDWSLIANEPYGHQDGTHLHLFLRYSEPKAKSTVLKYLQSLNLGGRVQVSHGQGDFNSCKKYLTNPDKDKLLDPNVYVEVRRLTLVEKYPDQVRVCGHCGIKYWDPPDKYGETDPCCGRMTCLDEVLRRPIRVLPENILKE